LSAIEGNLAAASARSNIVRSLSSGRADESIVVTFHFAVAVYYGAINEADVELMQVSDTFTPPPPS